MSVPSDGNAKVSDFAGATSVDVVMETGCLRRAGSHNVAEKFHCGHMECLPSQHAPPDLFIVPPLLLVGTVTNVHIDFCVWVNRTMCHLDLAGTFPLICGLRVQGTFRRCFFECGKPETHHTLI